MGQKVHPKSLRLSLTKDWDSKWFAKKDFRRLLREDMEIRDYIRKNFAFAGISDITISKTDKRVRVNIHTSRPGVVIGKKGSDIDKLRDELQRITDKQIFVNIQEISRPELDPYLVAESIAMQLKKRIPFRRAMKKAVSQSRQQGAAGVKIICSGRLGGAEIARTEATKEGTIPLHTLRANVKYGFTEAKTNYGTIGVKVWIYVRGDDISAKIKKEDIREEDKKD